MKAHLLTESKKGPLWCVAALACITASAQAQQAPGYSYPPPPGYTQPGYSQPYSSRPSQPAYPQQSYPQQGYAQPEYRTEYVSPIEFLPTVGRKFGDMFRRVFYGDSAPSGYQAPQGYPQHRSLDTAPPSYQSHYGTPPQPGYQQPGYSQPPGYSQQPRYQQPPAVQAAPQSQAPHYQLPPAQQRQPAPAMPQSSRMGSTTSPRASLRQSPAPKTTQSPPKKYTPPTITKKSTSTLEEMPPSPAEKKGSSASAPEYYPLPGAKPKTEASKPAVSRTTKTEKPTTGGNNGSFLKGKRASKEGRVISPYPPYQELDVTGLSSGSLALDPTTQKVFEVP